MTETEAKLRQLLLDLYVSSMLWREDLPEVEQERVLDTVLAAAEGRDFEPLDLPFPREARPLLPSLRRPHPKAGGQ